MSNVKKSIAELNLIEDFLFTEASIDVKTSELLMRLIIERVVGKKVGKLIIEPQKTINGIDTDSHGIRMDVSIKEVEEQEGSTIQLFDIEPNNVRKVHLPKRSRFYQALTDVKLLEAGVDYDKLPNLWSIWILPYDPFGLDYMIYSVKNVVEESPEIDYNDGVRKIFLYTGGKKGGTQSLKDLLLYLENSVEENAVDEELKQLHVNVTRLKENRKIGVKYMQMQEVIKYKVEELLEEAVEKAVEEAVEKAVEEAVEKAVEEAVEKAVEEAVETTEQRMAKLNQILLRDKKYEELEKISVDADYRKNLMEEYNI